MTRATARIRWPASDTEVLESLRESTDVVNTMADAISDLGEMQPLPASASNADLVNKVNDIIQSLTILRGKV